MTKILLLLGLYLIGHEPQQRAYEMPDMDTCLEKAAHILGNPPEVLQHEGGTLQASCALVFEPPHA